MKGASSSPPLMQKNRDFIKNRVLISVFGAAIAVLSASGEQQDRSGAAAAGAPCRSEMQRAMTAMHQAMDSVPATGDCDENFVRLMLPHHQAAIAMARAQMVHGTDPAMKRLAQEIITDQQ